VPLDTYHQQVGQARRRRARRVLLIAERGNEAAGQSAVIVESTTHQACSRRGSRHLLMKKAFWISYTLEQIQKFLGHSKLETTQLYAESSTEMMRESYQRALSR
jgi:site-specific recombinase XerD